MEQPRDDQLGIEGVLILIGLAGRSEVVLNPLVAAIFAVVGLHSLATSLLGLRKQDRAPCAS